MASRHTNLALAFVIPAAVLSGAIAMATGSRWLVPAAMVHGGVGMLALVLTPWKQAIVRQGWPRQRPGRGTSGALAIFTMVTLASGLAHAAGVGSIGPLTTMQVHVGAGLGSLVLAGLHYRSHPVRLRRTDWNRRTLLRSVGAGAAASVTWLSWEAAASAAGWRGERRRYTGSHEVASGDPAAMPSTVWINDKAPDTDGSWTVRLPDGDVNVVDLAARAQVSIEATLDCTGGWYSTQVWTGVPLAGLLPSGDWRSVLVTSRTGYRRRLPKRDAATALLATSVGDRPLMRRHGAPIRLVVPGRRGFWWVKWVTEVEVSSRPWWAQLPFPVT